MNQPTFDRFHDVPGSFTLDEKCKDGREERVRNSTHSTCGLSPLFGKGYISKKWGVTYNFTTDKQLRLFHPEIPQRSLCFLGGHVLLCEILHYCSISLSDAVIKHWQTNEQKAKGAKHNDLVLPDHDPLFRKVEAGAPGRSLRQKPKSTAAC